jgi:hypothetical protein
MAFTASYTAVSTTASIRQPGAGPSFAATMIAFTLSF